MRLQVDESAIALCPGGCSECIRRGSMSTHANVDLDEALGLNCAWYADILMTLTSHA